jgi:hypothetical protein
VGLIRRTTDGRAAWAILFVAGCGGAAVSIDVPGDAGDGDDGGVDATTTSDASATEASAPDAAILSSPAYAGQDIYCTALGGYCTRCVAQMRACDIDNLSRCTAFASVLSDAFARATAMCAAAATCGQDAALTDTCIAQQLAATKPTTAQQDLANAVCATCAPASPSCTGDFYKGAARALFFLSDPVLGKVNPSCVATLDRDAGPFPCFEQFLTCAEATLGPVLPKDACKDGG